MHDDTPTPCSEARPLTRPRYFAGQLLTADDFADEQAYLLDRLRSHNRLLHGYGTVCGLAVEPTKPPSGSVVVQPGVALDCCGREIVVTEPIEVDLHDLADRSRDRRNVYVTLRYTEAGLDPSPVPMPGDEPQPTRIREAGRVELATDRPRDPEPATPTDRAVPCPPCPDDRILLATITIPRSGRIDQRDVDASTRPMVRSLSRLDPPPSPGSRRCRTALSAGIAAAVTAWWITRRKR